MADHEIDKGSEDFERILKIRDSILSINLKILMALARLAIEQPTRIYPNEEGVSGFTIDEVAQESRIAVTTAQKYLNGKKGLRYARVSPSFLGYVAIYRPDASNATKNRRFQYLAAYYIINPLQSAIRTLARVIYLAELVAGGKKLNYDENQELEFLRLAGLLCSNNFF